MKNEEMRNKNKSDLPKSIRMEQTVRARVRDDQKKFVRSEADAFGKNESEIVRFSLDAIRGIFPPDFFPSRSELEEVRKDVLALGDVLADIRRTVKYAGININQIAKAINSGKVDEYLSNKLTGDIETQADKRTEMWTDLDTAEKQLNALRDIYFILETNMEFIFDKKPDWL